MSNAIAPGPTLADMASTTLCSYVPSAYDGLSRTGTDRSIPFKRPLFILYVGRTDAPATGCTNRFSNLDLAHMPSLRIEGIHCTNLRVNLATPVPMYS